MGHKKISMPHNEILHIAYHTNPFLPDSLKHGFSPPLLAIFFAIHLVYPAYEQIALVTTLDNCDADSITSDICEGKFADDISCTLTYPLHIHYITIT